MMNRESNKSRWLSSPFRIVLAYAVVAILWILLSDTLMFKDSEPTELFIAGLVKGVLFVLFTGFLLYLLILANEKNLNQKIAGMEQAQQELRSFIYRSSHDLRGPITTAKGLVALAKKEVTGTTAEEIVDKLDDSIHRLDGVMRLLIYLMELQEKEIDRKDIALYDLLNTVVTHLQGTLSLADVQLHIGFSQRDKLCTDSTLLFRILYNVLDNAIRFGYTGQRPLEIGFYLVHEKDFIVLNVTDNGPGIPPGLQERIFDMFVRGTEESAGYGLGLYVARKLAQRLHGDLSCTSTPGEGTCFSIRLPVHF